MSVNKVILVGRLGKDPETRYMTSGEAVTNATLATSENWKDKNGEKQERTEWHNLVFYRRLAEIAGEYLKKGSQIYVEGKLQTRKWQDKEGKERFSTEIVANEMQMLGGRGGGGGEGGGPRGGSRDYGGGGATRAHEDYGDAPSGGSSSGGGARDDLDDDIPF